MDASNATVTVTPLADGEVSEGTETVLITITGDAYVIGDINTATVYIADAPVDPTNFSISAGAWTDAAIWSSGHKPVVGQFVIVTNDVVLPEATAMMDAVTVSNATLTFSNWTAKLQATEVDIQSGSVLTAAGAFEDAGPSNRVALAGSNITSSSPDVENC